MHNWEALYAQYQASIVRAMHRAMTEKFWPENEERGFGARDIKDRIVDAKAAGKLPPFKPITSPTHTHTLRLPTADTESRLGCARWWP